MSLSRSIAFSLIAALVVFSPLRAQDEKEEKPADDKDKEALIKLLAKAENEYRSYFKQPQKTIEFWAAIKFELDVGKFDLAALHIKLMLEKMPAADVDADLAKIENAEGMSTFLKLTAIREKDWSSHPPFQKEAVKSVKTLIDRVTAAVEKTLNDPGRFKKFIPLLDAKSEEERAFAFVQINRSKERAAPYLIEALKVNVDNPLHRRVVEAMVLFDADMVPVWLEVLKANGTADAKDVDLRLTLLDIVERRGEKRAIPYLWHLSAAPSYPPQVNARAKLVLSRLMNQDVSLLPPAKIALVEMAERYYQHKMAFPAGKDIRVWPWDGKNLATKPVVLNPRQAEEYYGLRYAREALDLDPTNLPAQIAFLNLTLDRTYGADIDQLLLKPAPPALQQLLGSIDADLLLRVLERGLDDGAIPVILATTRAFGERGDVRAARASIGGSPQGVVRALYYPDRRVQFAAVKAMLRMPPANVPVASTRIVDVLRRFVAVGPNPKALIAYVPVDRATEVRAAFKETGLEAVLAKNIKEGFEKIGPAADVDVVFLHGSAAGELPFAIAQLRADANLGNTPILILAPKENTVALEKMAARYRHVKVVPEALLLLNEELKNEIEAALKSAGGSILTAAERKTFTSDSLNIVWQMARNEVQGYDVRPAQTAVVTALRSPETAPLAMEILSRLPGTDSQSRLATVALDPGQDKLRVPAAIELNRHVQKYGLMLNRQQVTQLKQAYKEAGDAKLKAELAITLGAFGPSAQVTGSRLTDFRPDAPMPEEKKKEEK